MQALMETINLMALRHSAFYSPYLLTMAGNHLSDVGLEANYIVQTPDNLVRDRLLDGSCHVSQSAVAASFSALENNTPDNILHFAQINSRDGFFIASRQPYNHFDWNDLTGKDVVIDHFFQPLAMLKYALYKKNINIDDLNVIDAGDVNQIDSTFRNGIGDFIHQQGPAPQQLEADGLATVVASVGEVIGPVAFSSLCATDTWLQTDMADAFNNAYKKSLRQCQHDDAKNIAKQLHDYGFLVDINFDVLRNTIRTYQALGCWNHDGKIGRDEYQTLLDVFKYSDLITDEYDYEKLVTTIT